MGSQHSISEKFYYSESSWQKSTVSDRHCHSFFEIYFLEEGSCQYFIDNGTYYVEAGDIVLIPEGIIHKTVYRDSDAKRRLIYCAPANIPTPVMRYLPDLTYIYRNKRVTPRVLEILNAIGKEYSSPDEFSESVIASHIDMLFFLLARNRDTEAPRRSGSAYTTQTIAYINEKYGEELTLPQLASKCAVTPEHLSRIFKRDTGFCISEYISVIRLQRAQLLLRFEPELSVTQIAERCGFSDSNYFSKRFKEMYGISPLKFRKG